MFRHAYSGLQLKATPFSTSRFWRDELLIYLLTKFLGAPLCVSTSTTEMFLLVSEYDRFVQQTDNSVSLPSDDRLAISAYGLAGEVGSVASAIKKRILAGAGSDAWKWADVELIEELGDVMWYCFALARVANPSKPINIFAHDIANLRSEIGSDDDRARTIARVLENSKRDEFLREADSFPRRHTNLTFEHYQMLAYLTARSEGETLAKVCVAVMWQLAAQILRRTLPPIELTLNQSLVDRPINDLLGEIAWHVSALASLFGLRLSDVAEANMRKVSQRWDRSSVTPLHDGDRPQSEQFPRQFNVAIVDIALGKSRMYIDGRRRLGNDLTDNSYSDDGYRFHDVMHLANVAHLGWSPVLRALMKRKRKLDPIKDEVEDGARAQIVEEAIIKAIHSEGERLADLRYGPAPHGPMRLFQSANEISFAFLKLIRSFVTDLEVEKNRFWEWEAAILDGHEIYHSLRCEGQGTVTLDLDRKTISFSPDVFLDIAGQVVGLGTASESVASPSEDGDMNLLRAAAMEALGLSQSGHPVEHLLLTPSKGGKDFSVCAKGDVRAAMWKRNVVAFRFSRVVVNGRSLVTALAISDD